MRSIVEQLGHTYKAMFFDSEGESLDVQACKLKERVSSFNILFV